jgi:hypothetical protein
MKCNNCGHENRKGAKHCKECGAAHAISVSNLLCPSCGHKNPKGSKFCDECGTDMQTQATTAPPPKTRKQKRPIKEKTTLPQMGDEQEEKKKKRHIKKIWIVLILLAVLVCCGVVVLSAQVDLTGFTEGDEIALPVDGEIDCSELYGRVGAVDNLHSGFMECDISKGTCEIIFDDITGLDLNDYKDIGINFKWGDVLQREADCDGGTKPKRCQFPFGPDTDYVDFYITLGECEEFFATSDGWIELSHKSGVGGVAINGRGRGVGDEEGERGKEAAGEEVDCFDLHDKVREYASLTDFFYNNGNSDSEPVRSWEGISEAEVSDCNFEKQICVKNFGDITSLELDDYGDMEITFHWCSQSESGVWIDSYTGVADCQGTSTDYRCEFPYSPNSDILVFKLKVGECEEEWISGSGNWIEVAEKSAGSAGQSNDCCEIFDVSNVHYSGTPGVIRYLSFDLEFECMPVSAEDEDTIFSGSTFIGADPQDLFWTDVECYYPSDRINVYTCQSTGNVEQKVSWTKAKLSYGECEWESPKFYSPTYIKNAPSSDDGCINLSSDGVTCLD